MTADVVEFTTTDTSELEARMQSLAELGRGWINIGPGLSPEDFSKLPPRSAFSKWISGRGPVVPMATWTPAAADGKATPVQIGISHGTGPNALPRMAEEGLELPAGWVKRQDHAKNGIVAEVPATATHAAVVDWLLRAITALSPRVDVGSDWIAETYGAH